MGEPTQRLDKWLWFARAARTRGLAGKLIEAGAITLRGTLATKPGATVRIGDLVTIRVGRQIRTWRVLAAGSRRGPPAEARFLYDEVERLEMPEAPWTALLGDGGEED